MPYQDMEESRLHRPAERIAGEVRVIVSSWPEFARQTPGAQPVRAADSIGREESVDYVVDASPGASA